MFTLQAAKELSGLGGQTPTKEWTQQLIDGIIGVLGQCDAPLEHRGPVRIENTHPYPETEPHVGEPGLTVCTSRANNQTPDPSPTAIYIECGQFVNDGPTILNGTVEVNGCTTFNNDVNFYGLVGSYVPGMSNTLATFCLTSTFTDGCAPADIITRTDNGSVGNCRPAYSGGPVTPHAGSNGPSIDVIDRTGQFELCGFGSGACGVAMYFQSTELTADCDTGLSSAGNGWWEVLMMFAPPSYGACSFEIVSNVCCIAGSMVVCTKTIYTSSPVLEGAEECGDGSAGSVCS